jgi:UDP-glucose 4-epimerase
MTKVQSPCKKLLITGAGGFLGFAVAQAAKAAGYEVFGIGRQEAPARLKSGSFAYEVVDLSDRQALEAYLARTQPEAIIHCAWTGISGGARDQDIQYANIQSTLSLVEIGAKYGLLRFIGVGSQAEYGQYEGRISETHVPAPVTLYGAAKLAAYTLARQRAHALAVDFAWLRLFAVYGPGDNPNWLIPSLIRAMAQDQSPPMTEGIQKWDYLFIDDAAEAVMATLESNRVNGTYNLSSGSALAVRDIAEMLRDAIAPTLALQFGTIPYGPSQIFHMEGDIARLKSATDWSPRTDLLTGLNKTIQHQKVVAL